MSAKEQIVTAYPDVETHSITADHEFVILACDGIWDVMSNQEVVDFCREKLIDGMAPDKICEELLNKCLAPDCELSGLGCDNMSCILVCLSQDRSPEEYLKQLKSVKYMGEEDDHQNIRTTGISSTGGIGNELDENEIGEEIFSTPSHSPPLTALTATVAVAEEEEESSRNDGTTSTAQTETSDEDLPPNQFKVQQEEPKEEQNEEELDCDTNKMTLERQEPQPTKDEDDDQRIIEE